MIFARLISAFFGCHFSARGIEYAEKYICGSRESKPQECHFDKWIRRILKKLHASFGGFARKRLSLKLCCGHDIYNGWDQRRRRLFCKRETLVAKILIGNNWIMLSFFGRCVFCFKCCARKLRSAKKRGGPVVLNLLKPG